MDITFEDCLVHKYKVSSPTLCYKVKQHGHLQTSTHILLPAASTHYLSHGDFGRSSHQKAFSYNSSNFRTIKFGCKINALFNIYLPTHVTKPTFRAVNQKESFAYLT